MDCRGRFLRLEYTAEQVAKLLGITPAMVQDLDKRGLLKLTKRSGTEVFTAGEVVNYLRRKAGTEPGADPRETHPDLCRRGGGPFLIASSPELRVSRECSTGILAPPTRRMASSLLQ